MKYHHLSTLFPKMSENDFEELKKNIKQNGLLEKIDLYEDAILDGRHRYEACVALSITPEFVAYTGSDPLTYVIAKNMARRNLTPAQKTKLIISTIPMYQAEAKKRKQATQNNNTGRAVSKNFSYQEKGKAVAIAAKAAGGNAQYVRMYKKLSEQRPDLVEKIDLGETKIYLAYAEYKKDLGGAQEIVPPRVTQKTPVKHDDVSMEEFAAIIDTGISLLKRINVLAKKDLDTAKNAWVIALPFVTEMKTLAEIAAKMNKQSKSFNHPKGSIK